MSAHSPSLMLQAQRALDRWADEGYSRINRAARSGAAGILTSRWIEHLNEMCDQYRLTHPHTVWRGIDHRGTLRAVVGERAFTDLGYMAASARHDAAVEFMHGRTSRHGGRYALMLELTLMPGCVCLPVHHLSGMAWDHEHEFLTGPARVVIDHVEQEDGETWASGRAFPLPLPLESADRTPAPRLSIDQINYHASCQAAGLAVNERVWASLAER